MSRKRSSLGHTLLNLLYIAIAIAAWQAIVVIFHVKEFVVPSPVAVFKCLFFTEKVAENTWWAHISTTLLEIIVSFAFYCSDRFSPRNPYLLVKNPQKPHYAYH
ncbi:MAG TPA: hypothetical protein PL118_04935 [Rectinema sp.]|nr:hypothetical protein [Rectinema sp.]